MISALGWHSNQQLTNIAVGPSGVIQSGVDLLGNTIYLLSGASLVPGLQPSAPVTSLYDLFSNIKTSVLLVVPAVNTTLNSIGTGVFVRFPFIDTFFIRRLLILIESFYVCSFTICVTHIVHEFSAPYEYDLHSFRAASESCSQMSQQSRLPSTRLARRRRVRIRSRACNTR